MRMLLAALALFFLAGCAARDSTEYFTRDELDYAIEIAYDTGYEHGSAARDNPTDAAEEARRLTNDMLEDEIDSLKTWTDLKSMYR